MWPSASGWACRTEFATSSEITTRASSMASLEPPRSDIQDFSRCRATDTDDGLKGRRIVSGVRTALLGTVSLLVLVRVG